MVGPKWQIGHGRFKINNSNKLEESQGAEMRTLGIFIFFLTGCIVLTTFFSEFTGLTLKVSAPVSAIICILLFLMLDIKPEPHKDENLIDQLTKESWFRKK